MQNDETHCTSLFEPKAESFPRNRQHRFRKGRSCETKLCAIYHELAKTKEAMKTTHAGVLDLKKAFDKVPHALLMQKYRNTSTTGKLDSRFFDT